MSDGRSHATEMANVRKAMADAEAKRLDAAPPSRPSPVSVDDPFGLRAAARKLPHTPMPQAKPARPQAPALPQTPMLPEVGAEAAAGNGRIVAALGKSYVDGMHPVYQTTALNEHGLKAVAEYKDFLGQLHTAEPGRAAAFHKAVTGGLTPQARAALDTYGVVPERMFKAPASQAAPPSAARYVPEAVGRVLTDTGADALKGAGDPFNSEWLTSKGEAIDGWADQHLYIPKGMKNDPTIKGIRELGPYAVDVVTTLIPGGAVVKGGKIAFSLTKGVADAFGAAHQVTAQMRASGVTDPTALRAAGAAALFTHIEGGKAGVLMSAGLKGQLAKTLSPYAAKAGGVLADVLFGLGIDKGAMAVGREVGGGMNSRRNQ